MSETITHSRLVGKIVTWVKTRHGSTPGLCIFCDCPTILETEKPSPIEGYFPDICAITTPPALTIIGEAKTLFDLESERSFSQLAAFVRFLSARPNPILIVAVPWKATCTAKNIIAAAKKEDHTSNRIEVHILSENL